MKRDYLAELEERRKPKKRGSWPDSVRSNLLTIFNTKGYAAVVEYCTEQTTATPSRAALSVWKKKAKEVFSDGAVKYILQRKQTKQWVYNPPKQK